MKKLILLLTLISTLTTTTFGQVFKLSPSAEVTLLTCGSGEELYSSFGHSAFRVRDPLRHIDVVYNYGTFNFNTPNFYLKFARGKLLYELDKTSINEFLAVYVDENRWVKEQVLNLNEDEKNAVFQFLETNARPENSAYKYDFFFNNCATKMKDVIQKAIPGKVDFVYPTNESKQSFRDLIHDNISWNSWGSFGIDICLGSLIDKPVKPEEFLFLPDYVLYSFNTSKVNEGEKFTTNPFTILHQRDANTPKASVISSPLFVFIFISLILILLSIRDYKRIKRNRIFDFVLFFITGTIGILLLLLWFATDHTATANNFNILWAFAPNFIVAFSALKKTTPKWFKSYCAFLLVLILLIVLLWMSSLQDFSWVIAPLIIALAFRYWLLWKKLA